MTASAHTTAMQAPTERNPDYRTREWRYEVVKPAAPSVWSRIFGWLGGLAS